VSPAALLAGVLAWGLALGGLFGAEALGRAAWPLAGGGHGAAIAWLGAALLACALPLRRGRRPALAAAAGVGAAALGMGSSPGAGDALVIGCVAAGVAAGLAWRAAPAVACESPLAAALGAVLAGLLVAVPPGPDALAISLALAGLVRGAMPEPVPASPGRGFACLLPLARDGAPAAVMLARWTMLPMMFALAGGDDVCRAGLSAHAALALHLGAMFAPGVVLRALGVRLHTGLPVLAALVAWPVAMAAGSAMAVVAGLAPALAWGLARCWGPEDPARGRVAATEADPALSCLVGNDAKIAQR